jgi:hypothetical protein
MEATLSITDALFTATERASILTPGELVNWTGDRSNGLVDFEPIERSP